MFETGITKEQQDKEILKNETLQKLAEIDKKSARPLRAVLSADTPDPRDLDYLKSLEDEAKVLREELIKWK